MNIFSSLFPGILVTGLIAFISWFLGPLIPGLNAVILGLLLGILVGNVFQFPEKFSGGIKFSSGKILEFTIVMLAFEVNLGELSQVGFPILATVVSTIILLLLATLYLGKKMSCPGANGWLIGFGTAICGTSAISALGPIITKDKAQIGISLAVINILGGLGIFFAPIVVKLLGFDAVQSGVLVGGSLHSMGHVAGAAALFEDDVRNVAISVKLVRIALLTPALIVFSNIVNKKQNSEANYSLKLPTYLVLFIVVSIFVTFVDLPGAFLLFFKSLGAFGLTISMVAIGMGISFKNLIQSGGKSLLFGVVIFLVFILLILGMIHLLF
jgi:uncharacterized integral membrane protein (TIGR00698 family)